MFEKVNPAHPDKIADRIAGAIVDLAYSKKENPKVALEVQIGHNTCTIINETNTHITNAEINEIIKRIVYNPHLKTQLKIKLNYKEVKQDTHLAKNQNKKIKCGDNGIFKGCPTTREQKKLATLSDTLWYWFHTDGKYIINRDNIIICQSYYGDYENFTITPVLKEEYNYNFTINPLGYWTGGINVDTGATNRKLGSDMGDAVTGGGLHGKDLSKADVSINIFCHLLAQKEQREIKACCAIGDEIVEVDNQLVPYDYIVKEARKYIKSIGGFEKLAEWGLIR